MITTIQNICNFSLVSERLLKKSNVEDRSTNRLINSSDNWTKFIKQYEQILP
jgi:hypothetical protein